MAGLLTGTGATHMLVWCISQSLPRKVMPPAFYVAAVATAESLGATPLSRTTIRMLSGTKNAPAGTPTSRSASWMALRCFTWTGRRSKKSFTTRTPAARGPVGSHGQRISKTGYLLVEGYHGYSKQLPGAHGDAEHGGRGDDVSDQRSCSIVVIAGARSKGGIRQGRPLSTLMQPTGRHSKGVG